MSILSTSDITINIQASQKEVIFTFLTIFLSSKNVPEKQLRVLAELVSKYAEYRRDKVSEPYASQLLFSTSTRKEICATLKISPEHLSNTFRFLSASKIIAKEDKNYLMNPDLVPTEKLTFNFQIT